MNVRNMRVVGHKPAWVDKVSVGESSCTYLFVNTLLGASSTCLTSCKHSVSCSTQSAYLIVNQLCQLCLSNTYQSCLKYYIALDNQKGK